MTLLCGDARAVLDTLPAQSVHWCITSPSYFGLRDYGCAGQIGLESTPQGYVAALVDVFRGVWRVLRDDGLLFIVLGDSYAGSWGNQGRKDNGERGTQRPINGPMMQNLAAGYPDARHNTGTIRDGMPPAKNLVGIPWRVAFALQDDGWILRQELIWAKPNPMPESVKDRCTRGHETVFMLAKKPAYYYDAAAIAEPIKDVSARRIAQPSFQTQHGGVKDYGNGVNPNRSARHALEGFAAHNNGTRNARTVWTIPTSPLSSKKFGVDTEHYAAFPPELVRPMVRAATAPRTAGTRRARSWRRVVERQPYERTLTAHRGRSDWADGSGRNDGDLTRSGQEYNCYKAAHPDRILGWRPTCGCDAGSGEPVQATVLDCFMGSGTTGLVAVQEGRRFVGIDLNPAYVGLARARIDAVQPPLPVARPVAL